MDQLSARQERPLSSEMAAIESQCDMLTKVVTELSSQIIGCSNLAEKSEDRAVESGLIPSAERVNNSLSISLERLTHIVKRIMG